MDPATIIGIGSTLLGGLFPSKPKYVVPDYAKIRSGAEAAGFNPLTALTQGPAGQVVQPENYMGNAIASAGLMLADNLTKTARAARLQKLTGENEKLQDKVQRLTLQPKVGGVYARRESVPTLGAALGRGNVQAVQNSADAVASSGGAAASGQSSGQSSALAFNLGDSEINSASDDSSRVPQKPLYLLGYPLQPVSGTSDSEAIGSRYGEDFLSPSWFAGWGAFGVDALAAANGTYQRYIGQPFVNAGKSLFEPNKARPKPVGKRPSWLPQGAYP